MKYQGALMKSREHIVRVAAARAAPLYLEAFYTAFQNCFLNKFIEDPPFTISIDICTLTIMRLSSTYFI